LIDSLAQPAGELCTKSPQSDIRDP